MRALYSTGYIHISQIFWPSFPQIKLSLPTLSLFLHALHEDKKVVQQVSNMTVERSRPPPSCPCSDVCVLLLARVWLLYIDLIYDSDSIPNTHVRTYTVYINTHTLLSGRNKVHIKTLARRYMCFSHFTRHGIGRTRAREEGVQCYRLLFFGVL